MAISPNVLDRDKAAYKENVDDGGLDRRVTDVTSQEKLDAIITALGGASNTTPVILNVTVALANTEVSQALPSSTKGFILRARNRSRIQLAFTVGTSNTVFITLMPGTVYEDKNFYSSQSLFFQCSNAGEIVEILAYT